LRNHPLDMAGVVVTHDEASNLIGEVREGGANALPNVAVTARSHVIYRPE
jgi:hypothetical protein